MIFDALVRDGLAALRRGDYPAAESCFRQACDAAVDDAQSSLALMHAASIGVVRQAPDVDLNVFRENLVRRRTPQHVYVAAYYLTMAAIDRNDRQAADRYLPALLMVANEGSSAGARLRAYDLAAAVESMRGNHVAAIEYSRVALDALRDYEGDDLPMLRAGLTHNLAYNCLAANEFAEALAYADAAVPLARELGNADVLRQALVTAAFAHLCREDLDGADELAAQAMELAEGKPLEKYVHYVRGEAARRRGAREVAAAHFRRLEAFYPGIPTLTEMLLSMNFAPFLMPE